MNELCIIVRSVYPGGVSASENAETIEDSKTVKETLINHDIVEIEIPIEFDRFLINQRIGETFTSLSQEYQACHIVINTHGARGKADMMDGAVQEVILHLSHRNISVKQISALLCNGMRQRLSKSQEREGVEDFPTRPSSMQLLQAKLAHTSMPIRQLFHIYGFYSAYAPIADKDKVVTILKGVGKGLAVHTKVQSLLTIEEYVAEIKRNIAIIEEGRKNTEPYTKATNVLGDVFGKMKENIKTFVEGTGGLDPKNRKLYESLFLFNKSLSSDVTITPANFHSVWCQWLKQHKIGSTERLATLQHYCHILSISSQEDTIDSTVHTTTEGRVTFQQHRFIGKANVSGPGATDTTPGKPQPPSPASQG